MCYLILRLLRQWSRWAEPFRNSLVSCHQERAVCCASGQRLLLQWRGARNGQGGVCGLRVAPTVRDGPAGTRCNGVTRGYGRCGAHWRGHLAVVLWGHVNGVASTAGGTEPISVHHANILWLKCNKWVCSTKNSHFYGQASHLYLNQLTYKERCMRKLHIHLVDRRMELFYLLLSDASF